MPTNNELDFFLDSRTNTPIMLSNDEYQKAVKEAQLIPDDALWLLDLQEMELQLFRLEKPTGEHSEVLLSNKKYEEVSGRYLDA